MNSPAAIIIPPPAARTRKGKIPEKQKGTIEIEIGSATVKLYYTPTKQKLQTPNSKLQTVRIYPAWTMAYSTDKARIRQKFSDFDLARETATTVATQIANSTRRILDRTPAQLEEAERKAREHDRLHARLLHGQTLDQAIDDSNEKRAPIKSRTVAQIAQELLTAKAQKGQSIRYQNDLRLRLAPFSKYFQCSLASITHEQLKAFRNSLGAVAPRTWNNYRAAFVTLFNFGITTGDVPAGYRQHLHECIAKAKTKNKVHVWTPEEMILILQTARAMHDSGELKKDIVPYLAIGGFGGCRSAERQRMDWHTNVDFENNRLVLEKEITKTDRSRTVPFHLVLDEHGEPKHGNLRAWLAIDQNSRGPICPYPNPHKIIRKICKKAGVKWRNNAMRDSFISYCVALGVDIKTVSDWAGNSPQEIYQHYLTVKVTRTQAQAWFNLVPAQAGQNVLPLFA